SQPARDLGRGPAAAERLDHLHGRLRAHELEPDDRAPRVELRPRRVDEVEEADEALTESRLRELDRLLRRGPRLELEGELRIEQLERRERVLDLAERREHR